MDPSPVESLLKEFPKMPSNSKHKRKSLDDVARKKRFSITALFAEAAQVVPQGNREGEQVFEMMMLDG